MSFQAASLSAKNPGAQQFLAAKHAMLIGADWVQAVEGREMDCIDPATGAVLARVPQAGAFDVDRAVDAARTSFDGPTSINYQPAGKQLDPRTQIGPLVSPRQASRVHGYVTEAIAEGARPLTGTVWINGHLMYDAILPIGGMKQSGWGRQSGQQAVDNYLELKTVCAVI